MPEEVREDVKKVTPYLEMFILFKDNPDHARMRKFLHAGFNLEAVHRLRGRIQDAADELLDRVQDQGYFDVCGDFAFLLPAYVLSDFLGVHEEDRDRVVQWSVDFIDFFNNIPITADTASRMVGSASEMIDYTKGLLAERRTEPKDDFLGTLANSNAGEDALTEDEIVANAMLLLLAGHVAVRNLVGNIVYLLLTHPDQYSVLRANPELLKNTIEETLRYEPPVTLIPRIALEDFDLHGNTIRAGQISATQHRFGQPGRHALLRPGTLRYLPEAGQVLELRLRSARLPRRSPGKRAGAHLPGDALQANTRNKARREPGDRMVP